MKELYDHLKEFNEREDHRLTILDELEGLLPHVTPKEEETRGQANQPKQKAMKKRANLIKSDMILQMDGSITQQWIKQFIPLAVLKKTGLYTVRLWAAGDLYMISHESRQGIKYSVEYKGRDAAMHAHLNSCVMYNRFVPPKP